MKRDIKSLNLIIKYCDDVASDIARFGDDIEDLMSDASYQVHSEVHRAHR